MPSHHPNVDDVVEATLIDSRRRYAIDVLTETDEIVTIPALARQTAERAPDLRAADPDDVTALRIDLYHAFVPKLAAAGVVEFDAENDRISVAADCVAVQERISALEEVRGVSTT